MYKQINYHLCFEENWQPKLKSNKSFLNIPMIHEAYVTDTTNKKTEKRTRKQDYLKNILRAYKEKRKDNEKGI